MNGIFVQVFSYFGYNVVRSPFYYEFVNIMHLPSYICTYVRAIPNLLQLQFELCKFSSYLASTLTQTPLKSKMIKGVLYTMQL